MNKKPLIIAEIGLNHLGDKKYAKKYLDVLLKTKIDGVSIQVREKEFYKKKRKKLLLTDSFYKFISKKVKKSKKLFGVALADSNKVDFFSTFKVDFFKIINRDLIQKKLVKEIYKSPVKKVYVSTGKSKIQDLRKHMSFLSKSEKKKLVFIHTSFTDNFRKINLNSIKYIKDKLKTKVGYGNHSKFKELLLLSLSYNPFAILFYVRGYKKVLHPDQNHSIELLKVEKLVNYIKDIQLSFGKYVK